ncbi:uncharacterized protein LOC143028585 [Oratosquilla oratoria]|uniref:uncharacterized protein LOC143028585 n=1 Tax=Oratosquilla oratoria TaxID=337810 RepID=UPI003F75D9CD
MAPCMKLMLCAVGVVLATVVSHADSESDCEFYCNVGGTYECCDNGCRFDRRCKHPDKTYVNRYQCPPRKNCPAIFDHKNCGTVDERCSGKEFCCPMRLFTGEIKFVCAFLRH